MDDFTVTSPGVGTVVDTDSPEFTGTGTPGSIVLIVYGARSVTEAEAGVGTVDDDGNFAIDTDFSQLEPGSLGTGADVYEFDENNDPIAGVDRIAVFFTFAEAPVDLIPLSLTANPSSLPVGSASDKGLKIAATGFSPNEELILLVTDPEGETVDPGGDIPLNIYANDEDGRYRQTLILPNGEDAGEYTVTLTGVRSQRVATGTFTVADTPVPPKPTPTVTPKPTTSPTPTSKPTTTAVPVKTGGLPNTGFDAAPFLGIGGVLVLAGAALVLYRRRQAMKE